MVTAHYGEWRMRLHIPARGDRCSSFVRPSGRWRVSTGRGLRPHEVSALYEQCRSEEKLVSPNWAYAIRDIFVLEQSFTPKIYGSPPDVLSMEEKYFWLRHVLMLAKKEGTNL